MGIPTLISTTTASNAATVSITSGIDSTYDEYMFVLTDINPATDAVKLTFQCSIDGGTNYNVTMTSTYFRASHKEDDSDTDFGYEAGQDIAQGTGFMPLMDGNGNGADESCAGILHLFSPSSTTYVKHWYARIQGTTAGNNRSGDHYTAGYFNDADDDINAIQFKMTSGNLDGVVQMYGIA